MDSMKIKRVLLVYPPTGKVGGINDSVTMLEPLGLEYVASAFKEQTVRIIDLRLEPDLAGALFNFKPDLIGFTALTCHVNIVKKLVRQCKASLPNSKVIVGGQHATVSPGDFEIPEIDLIVRGEGYSAVKEWLETGKSFPEIEGISVNRGGSFSQSRIRDYSGIDRRPYPRRELVAGYRDRYRFAWHYGVTSIQTSVGCPFKCNFCSIDTLAGGRFIKREEHEIIDELKSIDSKAVYITDDESMFDYKRMSLLSEMIKKEGINKKYILYARIDDVINHQQLFAQWKEIGLSDVMVGYESPALHRLNNMGKGTTQEMQIRATRILKNLGIFIFPLFIVAPDFDRDDFSSLGAYVKSQELIWPQYSVLTPLPGSRLYEGQKGSLTVKDWDYFDCGHAVIKTKLPEPEFYSSYKTLQGVKTIKAWVEILSRYPLRRLPELAVNNLIPKLDKRWPYKFQF